VAATRQETRDRRPKEAIALLEQNHKLGLKGERKAVSPAGCSGLAKSGQMTLVLRGALVPAPPRITCTRLRRLAMVVEERHDARERPGERAVAGDRSIHAVVIVERGDT
jgi:hypothetical protein